MNRRRAAAPSRMSIRSSGEKNTVCSTSERAALFLAGTPLTLALRRRPRNSSTSVRNSRSRVNICPRMYALSRSKPMSSRSALARGDLPQER